MWIEKRPLLEGWDPFNFFSQRLYKLMCRLNGKNQSEEAKSYSHLTEERQSQIFDDKKALWWLQHFIFLKQDIFI